ncbi:MAG: ankyrin repeat domain-containing protein [Acidiphilium sp.]|jgi:hypothetical protein|nr:ankyrin repeat domain-containing protein [Acidiphilium sp.]
MKQIFFTPDSFLESAQRQFAEEVARGRTKRALEFAMGLPEGVNCTAPDGVTALLIAVERANRAMISALLMAGANPDGGPDRAPINMALDDANIDILDTLLAAGANPDGVLNQPALMQAAMHNQVAATKKLLDYGANVDATDSIGITAISEAAAAESWDAVNILLDRGASIWIAAPASGFVFPQFVLNERLDPNSTQGQARGRAIEKIKAAGFPWPPPPPKEVKRLLAEGKWPPPQAR